MAGELGIEHGLPGGRPSVGAGGFKRGPKQPAAAGWPQRRPAEAGGGAPGRAAASSATTRQGGAAAGKPAPAHAARRRQSSAAARRAGSGNGQFSRDGQGGGAKRQGKPPARASRTPDSCSSPGRLSA